MTAATDPGVSRFDVAGAVLGEYYAIQFRTSPEADVALDPGLREKLYALVLLFVTDPAAYRKLLGICLLGHGHVLGSCDETCRCGCCGTAGCTVEPAHRHVPGTSIWSWAEGRDRLPSTACPVHRTHDENKAEA